MERVLRLDVHAASCTLAVISQTGKRLTDFPIETNGQALVEAIRRIPGRKHLVFEGGIPSAWLHETLSRHVDEIVIAGISESLSRRALDAMPAIWPRSCGRGRSRGILVAGLSVYGARHREEWKQRLLRRAEEAGRAQSAPGPPTIGLQRRRVTLWASCHPVTAFSRSHSARRV
jgi:hypothetical protein